MGVFDQWPFIGRRRVKLSEAGPDSFVFAENTSWAGKAVSVDSAMQLSTAFACIRLLAETSGTLPLAVYRQKGEQAAKARDHPLWAILHDAPNADQTSLEFVENIVGCLASQGDYFARKERNGLGVLVSLEPRRPDLASVRRVSGRRKYTFNGVNGEPEERDVDEDDVFHVKGFGIGAGDRGLPPITLARQAIGSALAADEAAAKMFSSGLQLAGFIETGASLLKSEQRADLQKTFEKFTGSNNAGKLMALEAGMKFVPIGINPKDAQMLETRAFNVEEICRWFRVPPFMVGHTEKVTSWGTGLEQQNIGFLTYALNPYLKRIEKAINKQLLLPAERGVIFAEFILEGLLRADSKARADFYSSATQNGWMHRDDVRAKENLPPIPDGTGQMFTVQSSLQPLDKLGVEPARPVQPAPGEPVNR